MATEFSKLKKAPLCIPQQAECVMKHKRTAELVADRKNKKYADVINHIRTRLRFSLLKSILIAIRGAREKRSRSWKEDSLSNIPFNLVPYVKTYEGY